MPPPSSQRGDIEPPEEITTEAIKGFFTGAARFGSLSILAHMILMLPHPLAFGTAPPSTPTTASQIPAHPTSRRPSAFRANIIYRPISSISNFLAPASRVYRPLTPQFKIYLQMGCMIVGGWIWAERRADEYVDMIRRKKRAERDAEMQSRRL